MKRNRLARLKMNFVREGTIDYEYLLAIIGSTTDEMRKRTSSDPYLSCQFDHIEASLQRIHNAIKDVQVYESTELLKQLHRQVSL